MKSNAYDTEDEKDKIGLVKEAPTSYRTASRTIPLHLLTAIQKMDISKKGISKKYLESFKKEATLDYPTLADALSVTRATLINKKGEQKFNKQVSERIVSLMDLYAFGYEVFESRTSFKYNYILNPALSKKPFKLVDIQPFSCFKILT